MIQHALIADLTYIVISLIIDVLILVVKHYLKIILQCNAIIVLVIVYNVILQQLMIVQSVKLGTICIIPNAWLIVL